MKFLDLFLSVKKIYWRILMVVYLAVVFYLCFHDFSDGPQMLPWSIFGIPTDKIIHFLMFLPSVPLFYLSIPAKWLPSLKVKIPFLFGTMLAGACVAAFTELGQAFTAYRTSDITDFYFDCYSICGMTVLTLIAVILIDRYTKRS